MDLSSIRKLSAEATPGRARVMQNMAGPVGILVGDTRVAWVEITPREQQDAALIAAAINLLRRLTDEGALERMAREIDPDAFKTKAQWYAYLGPQMADQIFARLQSDATVERMSPRRKIALDRASQALNALLAEDGQ